MYCPDITYIESESRTDLNEERGSLLQRNSANTMSKTFTKGSCIKMQKSSQLINIKYGIANEGSAPDQNHRDCYKF
jgi:hypothetical protein